MKIAFYTYDLFCGREYLMPWRTILEVAKYANNMGHDAILLNGCYDDKHIINYEWSDVPIYGMPVGFDNLLDKVKQLKIDVLYMPFTWRDGIKKLDIFSKIPCVKIAYITSGIYSFYDAFSLYKNTSWLWAKPYFIESVVPKTWLIEKIKKANFSALIGLTGFTTDCVLRGGFAKSFTIYPGKDDLRKFISDYSIVESNGLRSKKWYLFSGAPEPYRGSQLLIKALDKCTDNRVRLVLLMRTDRYSNYESLNRLLSRMKHPERIIVIREKLTKEQLIAFFESAWYVILPFIVIPSEIPLTYFESLQCGSPIISFENGGTTRYLKEGLVIANKSVEGMTKILDSAWSDETLRLHKSLTGLQIMDLHPSWSIVAKQWIDLIKV